MRRWLFVLAALTFGAISHGQEANQPLAAGWDPDLVKLLKGEFDWTASAPLVSPANRPKDPCQSIKDPSIVQFNGKWHLFCTIRSQKRTHQIEYLAFADWKDADKAPRHVLKLCDGYFCAPQVFYFQPQKKWYMIYQVNEASRKPSLQPAFSINDDIGNPDGWSKPVLLFDQHPQNVRAWIDFWVICDAENAYLFFTSNDGRMWRSSTSLSSFPKGWNKPEIVLEGDIFEASHTYLLKGLRRYLTVVEAQDSGRRYYKAYTAYKLDGKWTALADTKAKPFAGKANVRDGPAGHWTDSISHGEILRDGIDQTLAIDPRHISFLFQGVSDEDRAGKPYGQIPWRLGLLEPAAENKKAADQR